jgi:hypothetical protein
VAPIVLLAGLLLLLYGVAALFGGQIASSSRMRTRSRVYAQACAVGGVVLVVLGGIWLTQTL